MESKRERRPNVRLEELGDFPAAVACVISSPRSNTCPDRRRWRHDPPMSNQFPASASVPPSTSWAGLQHLKLDEADTTKAPELDFWAITRQSRLTNRSGCSAMDNNRVFAGACGFRYCPGISDEAGKKESSGYCSDSPSVDPPGRTERARDGVSCANSVSRWLEGMGFGRYAGVFEMHEVDEEALPLLTIQDLKEMGISAIGPRRKLYEAIRRVAGDQSPWSEEDAH